MAEQKKDVYSAGERGFMEWGQGVREKLFSPILNLLIRLHISPTSITRLSVICGLAACPVLIYSKLGGLLLLYFHVFLDGLDGPLARRLKLDSAKGSFIDTAADQLIVTVTMITLMYMHIVGIIAGGVYIFSYAAVVCFAMVRNHLNIPYSWLVRPRFVIYAWLIVEFYLWQGSINYIIWICNILLVGKGITGYIKIRGRL